MKKKKSSWLDENLSFLFILLAILPIIANVIVVFPTPFNLPIANGDWVGFYGNYFGSFLGFFGSVLIASLFFRKERNERKEDQYGDVYHKSLTTIKQVQFSIEHLCSIMYYITEVACNNLIQTGDKRTIIETYNSRYEGMLTTTLLQRETHLSQYELLLIQDSKRKDEISSNKEMVTVSLHDILQKCQEVHHLLTMECYISISKNQLLSKVQVQKVRKQMEEIKFEMDNIAQVDIRFLQSLDTKSTALDI